MQNPKFTLFKLDTGNFPLVTGDVTRSHTYMLELLHCRGQLDILHKSILICSCHVGTSQEVDCVPEVDYVPEVSRLCTVDTVYCVPEFIPVYSIPEAFMLTGS